MKVSDLIDDCEIILVEKEKDEYPWDFKFYKLELGSFSIKGDRKTRVYVEKGEQIK